MYALIAAIFAFLGLIVLFFWVVNLVCKPIEVDADDDERYIWKYKQRRGRYSDVD